MLSNTIEGTQDWNIFVINGDPIETKTKHVTKAKINAITWLLVIADMHIPTAKKAPAINQLPKYAAIMMPLSGSPK